jgi:hypothetical protein
MTEQPMDTKLCPYCGEEIKAIAVICRFCNRPMPGHENEIPEQTMPIISEKIQKKTSCLKGILIGLIIVLLIVAAGGVIYILGGDKLLEKTQPCYIQAKEFNEKLQSYFDDWDDANTVAGSTSRIALSPAVKELQTIRRGVADLVAPTCAVEVQNMVSDYMDKVIEGYLSFMADEGDSVVSQKMEEASTALDKFFTEYSKLKNGQPPYDK